jgi:hypothetical protein
MQQLMQQMQDMLLAATTPAAQSSHQALPAQQQDEGQGLQDAGSTAEAAAAGKPAGQQHQQQQQQRSQKQKQPKQKPERKKQAGPAADAAPAGDDFGADIGISGAEEQRRQVQEQAGLAEQHYQAWLQQQAQEAAAAELQALELEASADAALTPLQQMLKACGQQVRRSHCHFCFQSTRGDGSTHICNSYVVDARGWARRTTCSGVRHLWSAPAARPTCTQTPGL